jgi:hypothetical protein
MRRAIMSVRICTHIQLRTEKYELDLATRRGLRLEITEELKSITLWRGKVFKVGKIF